MKTIDLPNGGCIIEMDGETVHYTKEEIDEMERNYKEAIRALLEKGRCCDADRPNRPIRSPSAISPEA
jgi:hypothetical protein